MKAVIGFRNGHKMKLDPEKIIYSESAPMVGRSGPDLVEELEKGMVWVDASEICMIYYTPDDEDESWE